MDSVSGNCDYHSFLLVHAAHLQLRAGGLSFVAVMIQEDYHSQNPYHNAVHAADVTQAMHCYLREPKVRGADMTAGDNPQSVSALFQILFPKLVT